MANDLNKFQCIGRLGKDPEIKIMASGSALVNFSVALGETWKDKQSGEKQEKTEWVNIVAFGKLAEIIGKYLNKGSQVYLEGKLQTRKWTDKEGNDRWSTEIIANNMQMLGSKGERSNDGQQSGQPSQPAQGGGGFNSFDDDSVIPF